MSPIRLGTRLAELQPADSVGVAGTDQARFRVNRPRPVLERAVFLQASRLARRCRWCYARVTCGRGLDTATCPYRDDIIDSAVPR